MKTVREPKNVRGSTPIGPVLITVGEGAMKCWTPGEIRTFSDRAESRAYLRTLNGAGFRIFTATKLNNVLVGLGANHFEGTLSGRRIVKLVLDPDATIYGTREVIPPTDEGFAELQILWEWCRDHGAVFGSASWTSEQIFRHVAPRSLRFIDVRASRRSARGARKYFHSRGTFTDVDYVDLRAAYPWSMISEPIPERLVLDPSDSIEHPVGLALATVTVPDSIRWSPIYEITRFGMLWNQPSVRGWYPLRELRLAREIGCRVEPWIVYRGRDYASPFDQWFGAMMDARDLPGSAGRMGKVIANSLWGAFATSGMTRVVRFADDRGRQILSERIRRPPPPGAPFIATEVSARVRERIFRELIPSDPVYIDTDGGVIRRSSPVPSPEGSGIGEWSIRDSFQQFELVGIGAYAGHRADGTSSVILAGKEGGASVQDIRRLGGSDQPIADTRRSGFRGVKLKSREPWVWTPDGEPVLIEPHRWSLADLPADWLAIPPDLVGLGYTPRRVGDLRDDPDAFPIPF